jgi:hypothetical protein
MNTVQPLTARINSHMQIIPDQFVFIKLPGADEYNKHRGDNDDDFSSAEINFFWFHPVKWV